MITLLAVERGVQGHGPQDLASLYSLQSDINHLDTIYPLLKLIRIVLCTVMITLMAIKRGVQGTDLITWRHCTLCSQI